MHTEPCHSRRRPPLTLLLRGFAAGLLLLLLALSIRIHRGALSGAPTALESSSALAAASSAFTRTANRASEATSAASSAFTRTANRASEAASDTFVPERFTPPSGLPPGTTCEYLPPWLEAARAKARISDCSSLSGFRKNLSVGARVSPLLLASR